MNKPNQQKANAATPKIADKATIMRNVAAWQKRAAQRKQGQFEQSVGRTIIAAAMSVLQH